MGLTTKKLAKPSNNPTLSDTLWNSKPSILDPEVEESKFTNYSFSGLTTTKYMFSFKNMNLIVVKTHVSKSQCSITNTSWENDTLNILLTTKCYFSLILGPWIKYLYLRHRPFNQTLQKRQLSTERYPNHGTLSITISCMQKKISTFQK